MSVQRGTGRRVAPATRGASGRVRQVAWALVPLLSPGLFAFVPFVRLALARRRARDWVVCGAYLAVEAAMAPPGRPARSLDWSGAFQDRSSRAACGHAEQGEARRGAAPRGV